jgi:hypothetical protein
MGAITLQFVTTKGLLSRAIRVFERAWMSHVDSVMADGRLLGAQEDGVKIRPPHYEKFSRVERVVIAVPDVSRRARCRAVHRCRHWRDACRSWRTLPSWWFGAVRTAWRWRIARRRRGAGAREKVRVHHVYRHPDGAL